MIINLEQFNTPLQLLQEIPETFFSRLENSDVFDDRLLPDWLTDEEGNAIIFSDRTQLREKLNTVFELYKAIDNDSDRKLIIDSFISMNQIVELCDNNDSILCVELDDLHASIRDAISELFLYLYNSALNHPPFLEYVNDTLASAIERFVDENEIEICPFCGLETMLQLEGQARLALDHWLNKDRFPFSAINFNNLIPIGSACNASGVKGSKNILKNQDQTARIKSYYPFRAYSGIKVQASLIQDASIDNLSGHWSFAIAPIDDAEEDVYESWSYMFNIVERFNSYFKKKPLVRWQKDYITFIKSQSENKEFIPPNTSVELRAGLQHWLVVFQLKSKHGSIIYKPFIEYLINEVPEEYLYRIVENWKSQKRSRVI